MKSREDRRKFEFSAARARGEGGSWRLLAASGRSKSRVGPGGARQRETLQKCVVTQDFAFMAYMSQHIATTADGSRKNVQLSRHCTARQIIGTALRDVQDAGQQGRNIGSGRP